MTDPAEVARSYLSSFASGDAELVASHVTEGFINEHTAALGSSCAGRDEYLSRLPGFMASLPGLRYEVEDTVSDGDLSSVAPLARSRIRELDDASRSFNNMVTGLRERQLIRNTLGRFVPEEVASSLLAGGGDLPPQQTGSCHLRPSMGVQ